MIPGPKLYPDELLSSGLTRCSKWFSIRLPVLLKSVLKVGRQGGSFLGLRPIREAAALFGTSSEELLWSHTMFPYASAFLSSTNYERAIGGALDPYGLRTEQGIMRNAEVGVGMRRLCEFCLEEDLDTHGEGYWHRAHNLPGSFYCIRHRCLLRQTLVKATGRPQAIVPLQCDHIDAPGHWQSLGAWDLAVASQALLDRPRGEGTERPAQFYLSLAVQLGWMHDEDKVSQPALVGVVQTLFPEDFLNAAGVKFCESRAWPARAFNSESSNLSPLKHLMIEIALKRGTVRRGNLTHRPKGPPRPNYEDIDEQLSQLAIAELKRIMVEDERRNFSEFWLCIGGYSTYKKRRARCPKLREVAERFKDWKRSLPKTVHESMPKRHYSIVWKETLEVHEIDERLSRAAVSELKKVMAADEGLRINAFMKRIGALTAWIFYKSDCPKLVEVAERFKVWNRSRMHENRRPNIPQLDERLSMAAAAELEKVIATGERLTVPNFIRRVGAAGAWQVYRSQLFNLTEVVEHFKAWERSRAKTVWLEVDERLSNAALAELDSIVAAGKTMTIVDFMKNIGATKLWRLGKSRLPKLVEVGERLKEWNRIRLKDWRRCRRLALSNARDAK